MKKIIRIAVLASAAFAFAGSGVVQSLAQSVTPTAGDFPNHPIRIIVLQASARAPDLVARLLCAKDGRALGPAGRRGESHGRQRHPRHGDRRPSCS